MPYVLVEEAVDIIPVIKKYIQILQEYESNGKEEKETVIERFTTFDYWYYFDKISVFNDLNCIFIPNKFLGYQNHATEPYNTTSGCGADGGRAKKALDPFFKIIEDGKRKEVLENFQKFAEECRHKKKNSKLFDIFEPRDDLRKLIEEENLNKTINKKTKAIIIKGNRGK